MPISKACLSNEKCLAELVDLLESIPDTSFIRTHIHPSEPAVSSIGAHTRHIIEFYHGFFKGLNSGVINYDERKRATALEKHRRSAIASVQAIMEVLAQIPSTHGDQPSFTLKARVDNSSVEIDMPTCISRELVFLQNHSTHHMALISLLLTSFQQKAPCDFGVATSTRVHREKLGV